VEEEADKAQITVDQEVQLLLVLALTHLNNAASVEPFIQFIDAGMFSDYQKASKPAVTVSRNSIRLMKVLGYGALNRPNQFLLLC
jgi:hypothetical protein